MMELKELSCTNCAAPLEVEDSSQSIIKCKSCGFSVKLIDAHDYFQRFEGLLQNWLKEALPAGVSTIESQENIDVVARGQIFTKSVKPRLETEYTNYKFNCMNILSKPLLVLPFSQTELKPLDDVKKVRLFLAKLSSTQPLAVSDEGKAYLKEIQAMATTYANTITNTGLMRQKDPERFDFMARNNEINATSLENIPKLTAIYERILALHHTQSAISHLFDGQLEKAKNDISAATVHMESSKKAVSMNFELASMNSAIIEESVYINCVWHILDAMETDPEGQSLETLGRIESIFSVFRGFKQITAKNWPEHFHKIGRYKDILQEIASIRKAQQGLGTIRVMEGSGNTLIPFWIVEAPYSFTTGLFAKGKRQTATILVPASFPTDANALINSPQSLVTDVFSARKQLSEGKWKDMTKSLGGKETTITYSGWISQLINNSQDSSAKGKNVLAPLTSKEEAVKLVDDYMKRAKIIDKKIEKKLQLSNPTVTGIIYIPGELEAGYFRLGVDFGIPPPQTIGNTNLLMKAVM